jgi:hypothetical protein
MEALYREMLLIALVRRGIKSKRHKQKQAAGSVRCFVCGVMLDVVLRAAGLALGAREEIFSLRQKVHYASLSLK